MTIPQTLDLARSDQTALDALVGEQVRANCATPSLSPNTSAAAAGGGGAVVCFT